MDRRIDGRSCLNKLPAGMREAHKASPPARFWKIILLRSLQMRVSWTIIAEKNRCHFSAVLNVYQQIINVQDDLRYIAYLFTMTVTCMVEMWKPYLQVKIKAVPLRAKQALSGCRGIAVPVLNFGDRRGGCLTPRPRRLPTENLPDIHCIGGWVGLGTGLDGFGKFRP